MSTPEIDPAVFDNETVKKAITQYLDEIGPLQIVFEKLIHHAGTRTTTTYGDIAPLLGLPSSGNHMGSVIGTHLWHIGEWCKTRGWPPITSLVVKANERVPGPGFWKMMNQEGISLGNQKARTAWYHDQVFSYFAIPRL